MPRKIGNMLRRFRPQFGLRALFLAVTLVCLCLGHEVERWDRESRAFAEYAEGRDVFALVNRFGEPISSMSSGGKLPIFATITEIWQVAGEAPTRSDRAALGSLRNLEFFAFVKDPLAPLEVVEITELQRSLPLVNVCPGGMGRCGMVPEHIEDPSVVEARRKATQAFDRLRVSLGKKPLFEGL